MYGPGASSLASQDVAAAESRSGKIATFYWFFFLI